MLPGVTPYPRDYDSVRLGGGPGLDVFKAPQIFLMLSQVQNHGYEWKSSWVTFFIKGTGWNKERMQTELIYIY